MTRTTATLLVEGVKRRYVLAVPDTEATAVILSLHGSRSSAEGQERLSNMTRLSRAAGAVVAYPEAIVPVGGGYEWDLQADRAFLLAVVHDLIERFNPPAGRVAMTGMSGGARMSCAFAAVHAPLVSMVGAVAGLRAPIQRPARSVGVLAFHGTADRINPYQGNGSGRWVESVPEALQAWGEANGHPEPAIVEVSPSLTRTAFGAAGQPGEALLWTMRGAAHTWPGGRLGGLFFRMVLGRTSSEIDATEQILLFARHHAEDS